MASVTGPGSTTEAPKRRQYRTALQLYCTRRGQDVSRAVQCRAIVERRRAGAGTRVDAKR